MKCIGKTTRFFLLIFIMAGVLSGCGSTTELEQAYDVFETTKLYGMEGTTASQSASFFAQGVCVGGNENITDEAVSENISEAAGVFSLSDSNISYARNIHQQMYPASTTKILTAYLALKYGDLQQVVTVSENALNLEAGSTTCGLSVGDKITLEQLLYGLMMCSGNDAAVAIAETISGSVEGFAELMNQEALALGATNSHFVNPHGLHDEAHYTTVYDLYLIFQAALQNDTFRQIIGTQSHTAQFLSSQDETITKDWATTNQYLKGDRETPEGAVVLGGKTGTTNDAGYCLVLYSQDANARDYISIVLKAGSRDDLYYQMTELLKKTLN